MSPRISSLEAMTYPLSHNPLKRRWEVMQLVGEAAEETDLDLRIRATGLLYGRTALVQALQVIEIAEETGSMEHVERGDFSEVVLSEESEI